MPIVKEILQELWNTEIKYKGMSVNIFGVPRFKKYSKRNIRTAVDRLRRRSIIEKELSGVILSKYGKEYVKRKMDSLKSFGKPKNIQEEKNLLLMFDIPTERKAEREWLRWHLKKFGYILVQKSVWVGPSPMPQDFKKYLRNIKLDQFIRIFKLAKSFSAKQTGTL